MIEGWREGGRDKRGERGSDRGRKDEVIEGGRDKRGE